ncbi:uncharacterized protein GGS22DRAFT_174943 [Annulohypoxylon maeteangense]|uniref:uncharacterized protein n=1 Tax=Annulohypoxylon maeteangense TaxID=1927788 RepID=UPI00200894C8|nr:uncharacterized protein GGS22DRAFT_174943 [Annulohypoxylon maeteangense]KAI0880465.1 hypothetical protein GGS22DRAFT_174943 [Annulohypoxylon maeteangense]
MEMNTILNERKNINISSRFPIAYPQLTQHHLTHNSILSIRPYPNLLHISITMKFSGLIGTLMTAFLLPATQATWCQLYYDDKCEKDANNISFNCADNGIIGSGGGFIKCHSTSHNSKPCLAHRYNDASQSAGIEKQINADQSCINMDGAGPYYKLYLLD